MQAGIEHEGVADLKLVFDVHGELPGLRRVIGQIDAAALDALVIHNSAGPEIAGGRAHAEAPVVPRRGYVVCVEAQAALFDTRSKFTHVDASAQQEAGFEQQQGVGILIFDVDVQAAECGGGVEKELFAEHVVPT